MGATDFSSYGLGKTAREAFSHAQDEARYYHGHGGYSGTIAEKPGYVLVEIPSGVRCSADKFVNLVAQASYEGDADFTYLREDIKYCKTAAERRKIEAQIRKREKSAASFWRKINPKLVPVVKRAAPIYESKWDECIAIEIKGKEAVEIKSRHGRKGTHDRVFLFAGYASC